MLYALNTLKSNKLKAPFQRTKIAVSSGWAARAVSLGCHRWAANRVLKNNKRGPPTSDCS